jgi:hypothetical protein
MVKKGQFFFSLVAAEDTFLDLALAAARLG